jgi:hypothetical protein
MTVRPNVAALEFLPLLTHLAHADRSCRRTLVAENRLSSHGQLDPPLRAGRAPALAANSPQPQIKEPMRSELVYRAGLKIENKFLLSTTVMQAVRKLHINSTRTEDTSNRVLIDVAEGRYAHGVLPEIVPPPAIDVLIIAPAV